MSPVGWNCTISMSRSRSPARDTPMRDAVRRLVRGAREDAIHGRPAAHREERRARSTAMNVAAPHVEQRARPRRARRRRAGGRPRDLLEARWSAARHTCSVSRFMISMPVRSPLCMVRSCAGRRTASGGLARPRGDRRSSRSASPARGRGRAPRVTSVHASSWSLIQRAALERVEEVRVERVRRLSTALYPALHHPGAAGAAQQALDDDTRSRGLSEASAACSAAHSPAPPAPRTRMSVSTLSIASGPVIGGAARTVALSAPRPDYSVRTAPAQLAGPRGNSPRQIHSALGPRTPSRSARTAALRAPRQQRQRRGRISSVAPRTREARARRPPRPIEGSTATCRVPRRTPAPGTAVALSGMHDYAIRDDFRDRPSPLSASLAPASAAPRRSSAAPRSPAPPS